MYSNSGLQVAPFALQAPNGETELVLQPNGQLSIYRCLAASAPIIWSAPLTGTGVAPFYLNMTVSLHTHGQ